MKPTPAPVTVRPYQATDAPATLRAFLDAVTVTASADYSLEQVAAWSAPEERNLEDWHLARTGLGTVVALVEGQVAGFSDVSAEGYIHMMFVSPRYGRRGVGSALVAEVERRAQALTASALSTNASITARPFFEQHGFRVMTEQRPLTRGVRMTNYRMVKHL